MVDITAAGTTTITGTDTDLGTTTIMVTDTTTGVVTEHSQEVMVITEIKVSTTDIEGTGIDLQPITEMVLEATNTIKILERTTELQIDQTIIGLVQITIELQDLLDTEDKLCYRSLLFTERSSLRLFPKFFLPSIPQTCRQYTPSLP